MNRPDITNPDLRICKNCKHWEYQEMMSGKCNCISQSTLMARIMSRSEAWLRVCEDFSCEYFDTDLIFGYEDKPIAKFKERTMRDTERPIYDRLNDPNDRKSVNIKYQLIAGVIIIAAAYLLKIVFKHF